MVSEPAVIDLIDHLYSQRVEVIMDGYEEALMKVILCIEHLARGDDEGVACQPHKDIVTVWKVLDLIDLN